MKYLFHLISLIHKQHQSLTCNIPGLDHKLSKSLNLEGEVYGPCLWSDSIPCSIPYAAVNNFGQMILQAAIHCNAWARHLLSHLLVIGRFYIMKHESLHDQDFGHGPIHLSTGWHPLRDITLSLLCCPNQHPEHQATKDSLSVMHIYWTSPSCIASNHTNCTIAY